MNRQADSPVLGDLKSIAKQTSLYSISNILGKVIGFVMIPVYTHYLTPKDYGVIEILTLVSSVISIIIGMKMTTGLTRFYYTYPSSRDKNILVSTQFLFLTMTALLISSVLCLGAPFFSQALFHTGEFRMHFMAIFAVMIFETMNSSLYNYWRILGKPLHCIAISTAQLVTGLVLNIVLIVKFQMGIWGVLGSMLISNAIISVLLIALILPGIGLGFHLSKLLPLMRFSFPLLPAGILMFVLNMGDRFILNALVGVKEVGIYSLGYKFGMILSVLVGGPFLQTWDWKRVAIYESRRANPELFSRIPTYVLQALALTGLLIAVPIPEIVHFAATAQFAGAARVTPFVVLGYTFYILFYVFDVGIFLKKKTYWYILINAAALGVNLLLNFLLIPRFSVMGAAVATAVSFSVCPILALIISQRYFWVRYDYTGLIKLFCACLVFYFIGARISVPNALASLSLKVGFVLLFPVACWVLRLLDPDEIQALSKLLFRRSSVAAEPAKEGE